MTALVPTAVSSVRTAVKTDKGPGAAAVLLGAGFCRRSQVISSSFSRTA
jgi:hypothetical protein